MNLHPLKLLLTIYGVFLIIDCGGMLKTKAFGSVSEKLTCMFWEESTQDFKSKRSRIKVKKEKT